MNPNKVEKKPINLPPLFMNFDLIEAPGLGRVTYLWLYDFFEWWYIKMPILLFKYAARFTTIVADQTSFILLLRTFFVPWHRDNKPIGYAMGIAMRILYLPIAFIIYLCSLLLAYGGLFLWLLLPIITLIMILLTPIIN